MAKRRPRDRRRPDDMRNSRYTDYMADLKRAYADPRHAPFHSEGGQGAVLLVHGFPGTPAEMRALAQVFSQAGWTVDVPLLPGFGPDIDTLFARGAQDWLNAIRAGYRSLVASHTPVLLVGHSMGGAIAMRVAADVQAAGLIMLAPFWRLPLNPLLRWLSPVLRLVIRKVRPFRAIDLNQEQVQAGIREFMPELALDNAEVRQEIRNVSVPTRLFGQLETLGRQALRAAPDFGGPTLIVQGTQDDVVPPSGTRRLAMRLGGPVEYLELPAHHDLVDPTKSAWQHVTARAIAFAARTIDMQPER